MSPSQVPRSVIITGARGPVVEGECEDTITGRNKPLKKKNKYKTRVDI